MRLERDYIDNKKCYKSEHLRWDILLKLRFIEKEEAILLDLAS